MPLIETVDLWKTYVMGTEEIHALRGVSLTVADAGVILRNALAMHPDLAAAAVHDEDVLRGHVGDVENAEVEGDLVGLRPADFLNIFHQGKNQRRKDQDRGVIREERSGDQAADVEQSEETAGVGGSFERRFGFLAEHPWATALRDADGYGMLASARRQVYPAQLP